MDQPCLELVTGSRMSECSSYSHPHQLNQHKELFSVLRTPEAYLAERQLRRIESMPETSLHVSAVKEMPTLATWTPQNVIDFQPGAPWTPDWTPMA
ncbi:hypothetical protein TNCV_2889201 [Trichonephila clavipes]|nr:hypothetical protein TNCV_2889201 [Trichonephila clavipes]